MLPHLLTNLGIETYLQNEPKNAYFFWNNLPNITKYGAYVVNIYNYEATETHKVLFYVNGNTATYFNRFKAEHIPEEMKAFIDNKNIIANIYRAEAYDSIMYGYFCNGFIDSFFKGKTLTDFTNLFLAHNFKSNDKVTLDYCFE